MNEKVREQAACTTSSYPSFPVAHLCLSNGLAVATASAYHCLSTCDALLLVSALDVGSKRLYPLCFCKSVVSPLITSLMHSVAALFSCSSALRLVLSSPG